jgi:hypothetical protein
MPSFNTLICLGAELGRAEIRIGKCHFLRAKTLRRGVTRSSTVTVQPDSAANKRKDHRTNSDQIVSPQRHWTEKVE